MQYAAIHLGRRAGRAGHLTLSDSWFVTKVRLLGRHLTAAVCVYVLATGCSKIGLVPADQLFVPKESKALRCQALSGPTLVV